MKSYAINLRREETAISQNYLYIPKYIAGIQEVSAFLLIALLKKEKKQLC